ncbi:COG3519 Type VI protein secretion system component VasA [Burkholderiaceae bacterium]
MDFEGVYLQELARLRTLGQEFAQEQPMVASYLGGESGDPDVERLLQGVAFLSALVRKKLDDEVPEFINDVVSLVGTDIVGPLPAMSVLKLDSTGKNPNGVEIQAGSEFASQPIDGTPCIFSTSWSLITQPVELISCLTETAGNNGRITLNLELQNLLLAQWTGNKLSIYFSGPYPEAANMAYTVLHKLKKVSVRFGTDKNTQSYPLTVQFPGLDPEKSLFPVKAVVAGHLRWARQSQAFPERGFFIELSGFNAAPKPPGVKEFSIDFDFIYKGQHINKITNAHFTLNAVPACNIFDTSAIPIQRTGLQENYLIAPLGFDSDKVQIFDVQKVTGREEGNSIEHEYFPTSSVFMGTSGHSYQVIAEESVRQGSINHFLRLPFNSTSIGSFIGANPKRETLSLFVRCTNGILAERIRLGEINQRTPQSPEKITVTNITVPIGATKPAIGSDGMWKVAAHARLNLGAAADTKTLKELLSLYLPEGGENVGRVVAQRRRVEGIENVSLASDTRLVKGNLYRGVVVTIQLHHNFYPCTGDLYLFANVLAYVLAGFVELNTYVTLRVHDVVNGELYEWPYLLSSRQTI